jgi:hypothetical protein
MVYSSYAYDLYSRTSRRSISRLSACKQIQIIWNVVGRSIIEPDAENSMCPHWLVQRA